MGIRSSVMNFLGFGKARSKCIPSCLQRRDGLSIDI